MPGRSGLSDLVATTTPTANMALIHTRLVGDATGLYVAPYNEGEGNPRFEEDSSPSQWNVHHGTRKGNVEQPALGVPSPQQGDIVHPLRLDIHRRKRDGTTAPRVQPDISTSLSRSPPRGVDVLPLKQDYARGARSVETVPQPHS